MKKLYSPRLRAVACAAFAAVGLHTAQAQTPAAAVAQRVVRASVPERVKLKPIKVTGCSVVADTARIDLNSEFSNVPLSDDYLRRLKADIKSGLNEAGVDCKGVVITIAGNRAERYLFDFDSKYARRHAPFVRQLGASHRYSKALDGNILAMWQSHGRYYDGGSGQWSWQRPRLFQTVEDLYPTSYVVPFLMPMLENAGAYVWNPRERDTHTAEVIVDNDGQLAQSGYADHGVLNAWSTGQGSGFAYAKGSYVDGENPFADGTYRQVDATAKTGRLDVSEASWSADVPADGDYALYVSYKTLPNSVTDALYTVNCSGGSRKFKVNQAMAGGVWVYLGTFPLKKGHNANVVTLSNVSSCRGGVVTADAIKIGGGMGNIARRPAARTQANVSRAGSSARMLARQGISYDYKVSGYPRFTEGARYFLQWSGFPMSVYSTTGGINDYNDDYRSRSEWVNYLAGGSQAIPGRQGLNVPIDLSFAFHTDAGVTPGDSVVGTLSIYNNNRFGNYPDGTPRSASRELAQLVSRQIVRDVCAKFDPKWNSRGIMYRDLYEAKVPQVPAMLLELLSHQNFADMRYGLDPNFQFAVSRAIYKGILRFIAKRDHRECVVQPLPVSSFAIAEAAPGRVRLTWSPTADSLEPSARPDRYAVLERVGGERGFTEVAVVRTPTYTAAVTDTLLHSYRIVAINEGGRSFPSETLAYGRVNGAKGTVMVVNGFTRVSGPDWVDTCGITGFTDEIDHGVPYISNANYIGSQYELKRSRRWRDDDSGGWGASRGNWEGRVVAGNTFDYPRVHGEAIMRAGYNFVSSSVKAVEDGSAPLGGYCAVDLIMGKQKTVPNGRGAYPDRYPVFTPALRSTVEAYCKGGGNVLLSGSYVASDVFDRTVPDSAAVRFASQVLGYRWGTDRASVTGKAHTVATVYPEIPADHRVAFSNELNDSVYCVESPDAIYRVDDSGSIFLRYCENDKPAGVVCNRGSYRTVVMGFPFETILDRADRFRLMDYALKCATGAKPAK